MGRNDGAIRAGLRALRQDPVNAEGLTIQARLYHFARRYGESIDMFRKALDVNSTYGFTLSWLVDTYRLAGRPDDAFDIWLRDAKNRPWRSAEDRFRQGYKTGGWPEVYRVLLSVVPKAPDVNISIVRGDSGRISG